MGPTLAECQNSVLSSHVRQKLINIGNSSSKTSSASVSEGGITHVHISTHIHISLDNKTKPLETEGPITLVYCRLHGVPTVQDLLPSSWQSSQQLLFFRCMGCLGCRELSYLGCVSPWEGCCSLSERCDSDHLDSKGKMLKM